MTHQSFMGCCLLGVVAFGTLACSGDPSGESWGATDTPFSTSPHEPNHENITLSALDFLRPEVLSAVVAANVETDVQFVLVNANHFDDCNFSGGAQVVATNQAEAVASLSPSTPGPEADATAILHFARSLHAVQDFYAHSNWVELGGTTLVDAALTPFPILRPYQPAGTSGFVVVQGPKPSRAALTRDDDAAYPESAVVRVKLGRSWSPGLISGRVDYEPGDACPDAVAMTHEELNKDQSTLPGKLAQYEAAKALAIRQTRHEWCRLAALVEQAYGEAGSTRLNQWVTSGAAAPDCTVE